MSELWGDLCIVSREGDVLASGFRNEYQAEAWMLKNYQGDPDDAWIVPECTVRTEN